MRLMMLCDLLFLFKCKVFVYMSHGGLKAVTREVCASCGSTSHTQQYMTCQTFDCHQNTTFMLMSVNTHTLFITFH